MVSVPFFCIPFNTCRHKQPPVVELSHFYCVRIHWCGIVGNAVFRHQVFRLNYLKKTHSEAPEGPHPRVAESEIYSESEFLLLTKFIRWSVSFLSDLIGDCWRMLKTVGWLFVILGNWWVTDWWLTVGCCWSLLDKSWWLFCNSQTTFGTLGLLMSLLRLMLAFLNSSYCPI